MNFKEISDMIHADNLAAENHRLRERVHEQRKELARLYEREERFKRLVRAFDWCTEASDAPTLCEECPLKQTDALEPECEIMMRELGIEEDE